MLYEITIPQFTKMLNNLSALLDKAVAHADAKKYDVKNVLNSRLAPDQFTFIRQVQIACDTAKASAARLTGQEPPKHEDTETTVEELKARIKKVTDYLATFKPEQFKGSEERMIAIPRQEGKGLLGTEYVLEMAIPNVYFHVVTAYSILRHNGVEIGKGDFLGPIKFRNL